MQKPPVTMIVIYRIMQNTTIIPERKVANLPGMTAPKFLSDLMGMQIAQKGGTFCLAPTFKIAAMAGADIQALAPCFRMYADSRVTA